MSTSSDPSGVKKEDKSLSMISDDASNDSSDDASNDISEEDSFPSYSHLNVHHKPDSDLMNAPAEDDQDLKRRLEEAQIEIRHLKESLEPFSGILLDVVNLRAENEALASSKALSETRLAEMVRERGELMSTIQESRNLIKLLLEPEWDEKKIIAALHSDRIHSKKEKVILEAKVVEFKERLDKLENKERLDKLEDKERLDKLEDKERLDKLEDKERLDKLEDKEQLDKLEDKELLEDEEIVARKLVEPRSSEKKLMSVPMSKNLDASISIVRGEEKTALERENWRITQENLRLNEEKAILQKQYEKTIKKYNDLLVKRREKDSSYQSDLEGRVNEIEKLAMAIQKLLT